MATETCQPPNAFDLPLELKLLILDHLSDDEISPLALVWHGILPQIRARQFRDLTVKPQARFSSSGHCGNCVPISARKLEAERQCESMRRLTAVLKKAPEITQYIQSLTIWDMYPGPDTLKSALSRSPSLPAFVDTIFQMSNLSRLCLHNLDFYLFYEPKAIHRALRQCHITCLEVKSCTLTMSILLVILYAVVNLDVLRLEDLHLNPGSGGDYSEPSEHITDFDNVETWKTRESAFLCVDQLHMMLKTRDDWLFFDLLLSKSHSPMYDVRAFYMNYECTVRSQIDPDLYIERISQFIERNDLQELHLNVWDPDDYLPSLQHIGGVQILELGLAVSNEWEPHLTPLSWCTETLANIAQTSGLGYLTLTFEFTPERRCIPMPSTRWPQWEDLDRALLELELEELSLVFALRFVPNRYEDLNREVFGVDEQRNYETQMKSKIQTWILGSCLPEVGKQYFGRDDPSENIGTFRFEGESIARYYSSMILEAPSL